MASRVWTKGDGRPNGWSSTRNFHICLARVRTMIGRHPNGWSWIRNFHICWTRVRTMLTDLWTVVFELRFLPYEWARLDGNPHRPDGCINLPLFELGKKIWSGSITGHHLDGLLRRPDGLQAGTEASRYSGGSGRKSTLSERMMLGLSGIRTNGTSSGRLELWTDEHLDRMARRPDSCQGTNFSWLVKQCRIIWSTSK
jgi:hypothetical protein